MTHPLDGFDVDADNDIIEVAIATAIQIFDPKVIIPQYAETIYFVRIGTEVVEVSMNCIWIGIFGNKISERTLGKQDRCVDFTTSQGLTEFAIGLWPIYQLRVKASLVGWAMPTSINPDE